MRCYEEVEGQEGVERRIRKTMFEKCLTGYNGGEAKKKKGMKNVRSVPYQWRKMHNIEAKILELASKKSTDCVRLLSGVYYQFCFVPHALNTFPRWVFKYMVDLMALNGYNWFQPMFDILEKNFNSAHKRINEQVVGNHPESLYIGGFMMLPLVWLYEIVGERH